MGEFLLNPTSKKILEGRGMKLICSAPHCLVAEQILKNKEDPKDKIEYSHDELNAIKVTGHVECPKCGYNATYNEAVEYDEQQRINDKNRYCANSRSLKVKCPQCGATAKRVWSQNVVSKHIRNSHRFFHKSCFESMFVGSED